jgi:hypothetical protein
LTRHARPLSRPARFFFSSPKARKKAPCVVCRQFAGAAGPGVEVRKEGPDERETVAGRDLDGREQPARNDQP